MSRIISLITSYFPTTAHSDNIRKISEQSNKVIVCDNSNVDNTELFSGLPNLTYIPNMKNLGLSCAFNAVLCDKRFEWKDDDFIAFFDQDSVIVEKHIENLVNEFIAINENGIRIGCIGPVFYNTSHNATELPRFYTNLNSRSMKVSSIMTSSMITKYKILKEIGFWNQEIFLDLADWDICWRMQENGYINVMSHVSVLRHSIGEGEKKVGPLTIRIAKPFREYYETRDCQYLLRKKYTPFKYRVRFHLMLTVRPLLHLMFLDDKRERKYYIKLGVKDFKNNVNGELSSDKKYNKTL